MKTFFFVAPFLSAALIAFILTLTPDSTRAAHVYSGLDLRDGKNQSFLREEPGKKATVLIFLSAKCPCSISHIDEIKKLATEFSDFRFIGVNSNTDETTESAKTFFSGHDFPFPILKDEKAILANEMKAVKTPHAFILAADGRRIFQGGVSNSATFARADRRYLREALEDLKAGREVRTPLARALGCAITRGD